MRSRCQECYVTPEMRLRSRPSVAIVALTTLAGCARACGHDHPYVPYTIDSTASSGDDAAAPPPDAPDAATSRARAASIAPPNVASWSVDGVPITAPEGFVVVLGIADDFDGDGKKDAFAVVRSTTHDKGDEVIFVPGAGSTAGQTFPPPPELVVDATCAPDARMAEVGKHSVSVELSSKCATPAEDAPSRWMAVLTVAHGAKVHLGALLFDPPAAPTMDVEADAADEDGDGIDDVLLRVSLEGGGAPFEPGPKVVAVAKWLDRPAGLARDPAATEASFATLASIAMARASKPKEALAVPRYVEQARSLYRALCPEAGAPRIVRSGGAGAMACGQSRALEELGLAEVRAYSLTGDPLRAITALDAAGRPPATRTASRAAEGDTWIAQAAPAAMAKSIRAIAAVPQLAHGKSPSWGALAFEASGRLLVRTAAGVVRVDPELGDEAAADGVAAWPSAVDSPDGSERWIESYDPCDGLALRATVAPTGAGAMHDVALPIAPPFGPKCTSTKGAPVASLPLAWGAHGLEAIIGGVSLIVSPDYSRAMVLAGMTDDAVTPGSPRSPDGKSFVAPTTRGLLVRGARARMLVAKELDGSYPSETSCTVSNDAARVACVRGGKAWVGIWDP
jgi:hypothetical protein